MNSLQRMTIIVAASSVVIACATGPKHTEIASSIPSLNAGQTRVYFYRPSSMFGAAIQPQIMLNGAAVGDSKPGGFFFVDVPAGPQQVSTATEVGKKLSFVADAGQSRYVRTSVSMGLLSGNVTPELVDGVEGAKEVAELSYIGKPLAKP